MFYVVKHSATKRDPEMVWAGKKQMRPQKVCEL